MSKQEKRVTPVTSREYKMILTSDRFADRNRGAGALGDIVTLIAKENGGEVVKRQDEEERRLTWYLDTKGLLLRRAGFALRVRKEIDKKRYKTTLKFRSSDRYLAAAWDLTKPKDGDFKFEEDILPPFRSRFSSSNSIKTKTAKKIGKVKDAAKIFPALKQLDIDPDLKLAAVGDFKAHEIARDLCQLEFGAEPVVKAGISFWYLTKKKAGTWPLIAEFSFDFDFPKPETVDPKLLKRVNGFFSSLQGQPGWFNFEATTKTSYVYEGLA